MNCMVWSVWRWVQEIENDLGGWQEMTTSWRDSVLTTSLYIHKKHCFSSGDVILCSHCPIMKKEMMSNYSLSNGEK